jgi:hypothetical protein
MKERILSRPIESPFRSQKSGLCGRIRKNPHASSLQVEYLLLIPLCCRKDEEDCSQNAPLPPPYAGWCRIFLTFHPDLAILLKAVVRRKARGKPSEQGGGQNVGVLHMEHFNLVNNVCCAQEPDRKAD